MITKSVVWNENTHGASDGENGTERDIKLEDGDGINKKRQFDDI